MIGFSAGETCLSVSGFGAPKVRLRVSLQTAKSVPCVGPHLAEAERGCVAFKAEKGYLGSTCWGAAATEASSRQTK